MLLGKGTRHHVYIDKLLAVGAYNLYYDTLTHNVFITTQIAQHARPMLFKLAGQLEQFEQAFKKYGQPLPLAFNSPSSGWVYNSMEYTHASYNVQLINALTTAARSIINETS